MGIESDQLVFDYLSRVGDLAQQRQLPSGARMRLVSDLRGKIDHSRARPATPDSPAAVRRILARLGSPEDVVDAAGGAAGGGSIPEQPRGYEKSARDTGTGTVPGPRAPGHGGLDDPGDAGSGDGPAPDWWRVDSGPFGAGERVGGFVGGIEIPELLYGSEAFEETERRTADKAEPKAKTGAAAPEATVEIIETVPEPRRRLRVPRPPSFANPLLLLAAASLVVGAFLGNWILLAAGWVLAWASRRLTPNESKAAVIGIPTLSVIATGVWLWGRRTGRWGEPLAENHMSAAIGDAWPWVVRGAAVASALFVVWRSQRGRRGE